MNRAFIVAKQAYDESNIARRLCVLMFTAMIIAGPAVAETSAADALPEGTSAPVLRVLHILTSGVYLDGGEGLGLSQGDRFVVERNGEPVADLEVVHVAADKTACRVLELHRDLEIGDRAVAVEGPAATDRAAEIRNYPSASSSAEPVPRRPITIGEAPRKTEGTGTIRVRGQAEAVTVAEVPWAETSGTISARLHQFSDGTAAGRDFSQNTMQLNLRMKEIGGTPLAMRVRVRGRENERTQSDGSTVSDRRDRLYELSLSYEQPDGKYSFQLGRLRSGPLVGFDYLDGVVAEVGVAKNVKVGGFFGNRPNIDEISFDSIGSTYGAFVHYRKKRSRDNPFYAEVLVGGISESFDPGQGVDRQYLSLYSRLGSGSRWSLYQRAEIDLGDSAAGDSYQVSNLLLSGSCRFNESFRLGVSYDLRRRLRDLDDRDTPEEVFDDQLRDGLRVTFYLGDSKGWRASTSFGRRRLQSTGENTDTFTGSFYNSDFMGKNLLLGLDASGFSGPTSEGFRVSLRSRKYFKGGHDVGLLVGASETEGGALGVVRENRWIRLTGTARLPKGFFVVWEVEQADGDDVEGLRTVLQLGFRF